jgi:hypothetical protein
MLSSSRRNERWLLLPLANFTLLAGADGSAHTPAILLFRTIGCVLSARKGALAFRFPGL